MVFHSKKPPPIGEFHGNTFLDTRKHISSSGFYPKRPWVKEFAARVIKAGGNNEPLGKAWIKGFLQRNPEVKTIRGRLMDSCRVNGAGIKNIKDFFCHFKIPEIKDIPLEHCYNMNETGILEGRGSNGLVLGHAGKKAVIIRQLGSRYWTTICECISALRQALTPLQWFLEILNFLDGWMFKASEKGWMSDAIALK
ncbi:hypothetical protein MKX08_003193 [Trichoderma sp. CBMAI-0020]|nr:hypothetical protein MKX08_003193 [Trichoderma sp. CBMAI-0020]